MGGELLQGGLPLNQRLHIELNLVLLIVEVASLLVSVNDVLEGCPLLVLKGLLNLVILVNK